MRKELFACIISVMVCSLAFGQLNLMDESTKALRNFSKKYFRSDPFYGSFSGFLTHLLNDPDIDNKAVIKKTDTSFYRFSGVYKNNNPFFFNPKRIEVVLQETPIEYNDSLHTKDTVFLYQLLAFTDDDNKSVKEIKKEFEKIHRQNGRKFYDSHYLEEKKGTEVSMAAYHYFVITNWIAPITVAWGKIEVSHETVLNITLRIKMNANETILPGPFVIDLPEKIMEVLRNNYMQ